MATLGVSPGAAADRGPALALHNRRAFNGCGVPTPGRGPASAAVVCSEPPQYRPRQPLPQVLGQRFDVAGATLAHHVVAALLVPEAGAAADVGQDVQHLLLREIVRRPAEFDDI